ncbi:hypothetical protein MKX01_007415 [Papaver californicum]|nr:hypothetical protein MKX01_007415 [Papaver californicum]
MWPMFLEELLQLPDSWIHDLEKKLHKQFDQRNLFEIKLKEASGEPGTKEIILEFKALLSLFPKKMSIMQGQLSEYNEAALKVHSLRTEAQSLSRVLNGLVHVLFWSLGF